MCRCNQSQAEQGQGGRSATPVKATMTSDDATQSAIATAEDLREDLEAVAESELPFAYDAEQMLEAIEQADTENQ